MIATVRVLATQCNCLVDHDQGVVVYTSTETIVINNQITVKAESRP